MEMLAVMADHNYIVKNVETLDGTHVITFYHHPVIQKYKKDFPNGIETFVIDDSQDRLTSVVRKDGRLEVSSCDLDNTLYFNLKLSFKVSPVNGTTAYAYPDECITFQFDVECEEFDKVDITDTDRDVEIQWNEDRTKVTVSVIATGSDENLSVKFQNTTDMYRANLLLLQHKVTREELDIPLLDADGETVTFERLYSGSAPVCDAVVTATEDWLKVQYNEDGSLSLTAEPNISLYERSASFQIEIPSLRAEPFTWNVTQNYLNKKKDGCVWFECIRFKRAVVEMYDTNGDLEISYAEAAVIEHLDVSNRGITLMTGIEHMSGLRSLNFAFNDFVPGSTVDLSGSHHYLNEIRWETYVDITLNITGCALVVNLMDIGRGNKNINTLIFTERQDLASRSDKYPIEIPESYVSTDYSMEGEEVVLQKHTRGEGIKIQFRPRGFVDYDITTGFIESQARHACDIIFSVEPFKSYRDCFDISIEYHIDETRNAQIVLNHSMDPNDYEIFLTSQGGYRGWLYSQYCKVRTPFIDDTSVPHEFAHAFANLRDEGYSHSNTEPCANVSASTELSEIPWRRFLEDPYYSQVTGVYRIKSSATDWYVPSRISLFTHNIYAFNPPCRYEIFKTIVCRSRIAEEEFFKTGNEEILWEMFKEYDVVNREDDMKYFLNTEENLFRN